VLAADEQKSYDRSRLKRGSLDRVTCAKFFFVAVILRTFSSRVVVAECHNGRTSPRIYRKKTSSRFARLSQP